jgi:hypothetical protein
MRRVALFVLIALVVAPAAAHAHVGSPDVFFEGDAGPYRLFVTVRTPPVIPGVATIEIRSESPDVQAISVVPMRLSGPGSELPPTPDRATRSAADPQFFSASLWLMEHGSMQVRISVDGARGAHTLAVPVPAFAQRTLTMTRGLGGLLIALMLVLALAIVGIVAGAVREATLEPAQAPPPRARRRARIAAVVVGAVVIGVVALGNAWWDAEASAYAQMVLRPWQLTVHRDGCRLVVPGVEARLLPDHGHDMHLFLIRTPGLDRLVHVHPTRAGDGFAQALPSMTAGRYLVFADVVLDSGFPVTGTATIDVPALTCDPLAGDDTAWAGEAPHGPTSAAVLADGTRMIWERPATLRAGVALPLAFRVVDPAGAAVALEPYMGMAGHAEIVRADGSVFAHVHPSGSVAMPALALASGGAGAHARMSMSMPAAGDAAAAADAPPGRLAFPYGFPQPGDYRVFVQIKHAGQILTGAFDAHVEP